MQNVYVYQMWMFWYSPKKRNNGLSAAHHQILPNFPEGQTALAANDSFQTVGSEPGFSSTKPMVFLEGFVVQCVVFTKRWCDF